MRNIKLILTDNLNNTTISGNGNEVYKFDVLESDEEKLKKIVIDINKSQNEMVYLITNKKDLFEFFNRNITCEYFDSDNDGKNSIPQREIKININSWFPGIFQNVRNIFFNNANEVLFNYGDIFQIDIEKLVKGTTYNVSNRNDLSNLLIEDLNLINFKGIVTSRLCVIFYRLTYFDLNASKASIGRFFANHFEKSKSFKMNLNGNPNGWFFTELNNKIFRGYKIKPLKLEIPDSTFDLKIKIAKNLLRNDVKLKIVAESLEISEEELKDVIYNQTKALFPIL
ncbi:hypothetical protein ACNSOS_00170 [Aliarcobacter vitoriensis]|uniref:hypothetical protein n=1 Tax=Aliarcobacter vitoriensis TaxID=2011099 RepID=UPI003AAE8177